jgi:hypothetical protein
MGSSTACVLTINLSCGRLQAATLGDSGAFVIGRPSGGGRLEVKFRTPQQEHEFGRPFQLGHFQHADMPEVRRSVGRDCFLALSPLVGWRPIREAVLFNRTSLHCPPN